MQMESQGNHFDFAKIKVRKAYLWRNCSFSVFVTFWRKLSLAVRISALVIFSAFLVNIKLVDFSESHAKGNNKYSITHITTYAVSTAMTRVITHTHTLKNQIPKVYLFFHCMPIHFLLYCRSYFFEARNIYSRKGDWKTRGPRWYSWSRIQLSLVNTVHFKSHCTYKFPNI